MLDLWRGLALADMVLVHLAWNRVVPEAFGALGVLLFQKPGVTGGLLLRRLREALRAPVAAAAAIALCCLGLGATRVVTLSRFGPSLPVAIADEGIAPVHDGVRSAD
jgi:hypothetical protein